MDGADSCRAPGRGTALSMNATLETMEMEVDEDGSEREESASEQEDS